MDNETKITNEKINEILGDYNQMKDKTNDDLSQLISKHLTKEQSQSLYNIMNDRDKMESILSSPLAKMLAEKYHLKVGLV